MKTVRVDTFGMPNSTMELDYPDHIVLDTGQVQCDALLCLEEQFVVGSFGWETEGKFEYLKLLNEEFDWEVVE